MIRPLPPIKDVSLFRVEESEAERELQAMLKLASPGDPDPTIFAQVSPQEYLEELPNPTQDVEQVPLSHSVPNPAPKVPNPNDLSVQPSSDMQVDQSNITPIVTLPQDKIPTRGVSPVNSTPASTKSNEGIPPASEPPQFPSWDPINFLRDEDEDEEEIPSINMDSDSN